MTDEPPVRFTSLAAHPDGRVHICNRDDGHNGRHKCKCGATHAE